ncbi:fatty acid amide hydrolase 1-like isoform X1 [Argonauta hians]
MIKIKDLPLSAEVIPYAKTVLIISGGVLLVKVFNQLRLTFKVKQAMRKAFNKRAQELMALRERLHDSGLTEEMKCYILSLDIVQLQKQLKDRSLKSIDVLRAYQYKALDAQDKLNCIAAVIPDAEHLAEECDLLPTVTKPLHGIPISLKESMLYKCLKELGAVPFVTTMVPQGMFTVSCDNNIFGQTKNPHNPTRCPGGSSGGEAALIGHGGSILGIGTDRAGSLRCPAHFCGIYALKASSNRLLTGNCFEDSVNRSFLQTSIGPMSPTAEGLIFASRALFSEQVVKMDPHIPPITFQLKMFNDKTPLRIGYYVFDNIVKPTPACCRAVMEAKKYLESCGHTVIEFKPPNVLEALCLSMNMLWMEGNLIGNLLTSSDIFHLALRRVNYSKKFSAAMRFDELDAIICPVMASPSLKINSTFFERYPTYAILYNLLDFAVVSMPLTKVTNNDLETPYQAHTFIEKRLEDAIPGSVGLPVNIQIVAPTYKDEMALRIMKDLEGAKNAKSTKSWIFG